MTRQSCSRCSFAVEPLEDRRLLSATGLTVSKTGAGLLHSVISNATSSLGKGPFGESLGALGFGNPLAPAATLRLGTYAGPGNGIEQSTIVSGSGKLVLKSYAAKVLAGSLHLTIKGHGSLVLDFRKKTTLSKTTSFTINLKEHHFVGSLNGQFRKKGSAMKITVDAMLNKKFFFFMVNGIKR
jgi:hypothetical protein